MDLDTLLSFAEALFSLLYSIILGIKMAGSNCKLRSTQLIVASILSGIVVSVLLLVSTAFTLENINGNAINPLYIAQSVVLFIQVISYIILLDVRNYILIDGSKSLFILNRVLISMVVISLCINLIPFWIGAAITLGTAPNLYTSGGLLLTISNVGVAMTGVFLGIYDIVSSIYLLRYYEKYFFKSYKLELLKPQMLYRRNWIIFVIICDILIIPATLLSALSIYINSLGFCWELALLFQLNTMIEFVRFDAVRHEIVISDYTVCTKDMKTDIFSTEKTKIGGIPFELMN